MYKKTEKEIVRKHTRNKLLYVLLILLSNTCKLTVIGNLTVNYWLSINTENSELPF